MYGNSYMPQGFNRQEAIDRINAQMNELEKMKQQMQQTQPQPTNLTQNFQLAPQNRDVIKYATSIDEVNRDMVIGDTPYFSKDMSVVWIKNTKGEIKTYELNEIIPKDNKDILIASLQMQIEELRKEVKANAKSIDEYVDESNQGTKSPSVSTVSKSKAKSK